MKNLYNHTPHEICIFSTHGMGIACFPPVLPTIRLEGNNSTTTTTTQLYIEDIIPIVAPPHYDDINYIPEDKTTSVIVSSMVAEFIMSRPDLARQFEGIYAPDTSPDGVVRNDKGQIVGTRRLVQYK